MGFRVLKQHKCDILLLMNKTGQFSTGNMSAKRLERTGFIHLVLFLKSCYRKCGIIKVWRNDSRLVEEHEYSRSMCAAWSYQCSKWTCWHETGWACLLHVHISVCVHACVYIVPIAAGFQRGILETSTEEATLKKKKTKKKMKGSRIKERNCRCQILQRKVKHQERY